MSTFIILYEEYVRVGDSNNFGLESFSSVSDDEEWCRRYIDTVLKPNKRVKFIYFYKAELLETAKGGG